eukprot:15435210-Alexandrium_andersonii.AAC.1
MPIGISFGVSFKLPWGSSEFPRNSRGIPLEFQHSEHPPTIPYGLSKGGRACVEGQLENK